MRSFEAAQKLRGDQQLLEAKTELITCAQEQCPEVVRNKCIEWLREVERAIPTIVVAVKDQAGNDTTAAAIWIDGELSTLGVDGKPIALNPGAHELRVEIKGAAAPKVQNLVIVQGEQFRKVEVSFAPSTPPPVQPVQPLVPPGYPPPFFVPPPTKAPPEVIDWDPDEPVPPGYRSEDRIRKGLVVGGAITSGVLWVGSIIAASVLGSDGDRGARHVPLYFPVVGPFIAAGTLPAKDSGLALAIIDGVGQSAGAAMLISGILAEKTVLVRKPPMLGDALTIDVSPLSIAATLAF